MPFLSLSLTLFFFLFFALLAFSKASDAVLNRSSEGGHFYLFLILQEMLSAFSLLCIMLAVGFSYVAFITLKTYLYTQFVESFYY